MGNKVYHGDTEGTELHGEKGGRGKGSGLNPILWILRLCVDVKSAYADFACIN
jgi:hypothetical protein